MTVAAMIEIGASGHSEPGQSLHRANAAGKAQGAEWSGAFGVSASTFSIPAAASFRSSWQSMLASLNSDLECSGKEGTESDESSAAAEGHNIKSAQDSSARVALTSQISSQRSRLESSNQIASPAGENNLSVADTASGTAVSRTAIGALRQSTSSPRLKSGATISARSKEETASNSRTASSGKSAKPEAASGEVAVTNFVTAQSISFAIPTAVAEVQPSGITNVPTQTSLTDLSSEFSIAFTSGSIQSASSFPGSLVRAVEGTIAVGNQAACPLKTVAEGECAQSPHSYDPIAPAAEKSANNSTAQEVEAVNPAPLGKSSTAYTKSAHGAEHGSAQIRSVEEVKFSATNGMATPAAGEELSFSGRIRPPTENTANTLTDSQPRSQGQPAVPGVDGVAAPTDNVAMDQSPAMSNAAASQSAPVLDMAPTTGKAAPAGSSKAASVQAGSRSSHAAAAVHGDRRGQAVQAVQDGANNAALARDPSAVRSAVNFGGESAAATSKGESTAQATFAALDTGSSPGTTTWVHAGTRSAEAGFQDPTLGWVGVRADASGGGVHASLVPGSAEAAVTLGGHLAGLNSYLAEQHTPVDSITLAAPEDRSARFRHGAGRSAEYASRHASGGGTGYGAGQSSSQHSSTQVSAPVLTGAVEQ